MVELISKNLTRKVSLFNPVTPQRNSYSSHPPTTTRIMAVRSLYIGNCPWKAKEEDLRALFSAYGSIDSVKIRRSNAFLDYADDKAAKACLDDFEADQKRVRARRSSPSR